MRKHSKLILVLLSSLPMLAGCHSMQTPDKSATITPSGTYNRGYNPNAGNAFVPPTPGTQEPIVPIASTDMNPNARNDVLPGNIDFNNPPADLILATVHFGFNEYNIGASDRKLLETAAKSMAADPTIRVVAVGHCDWYGSEQYNLALGERRSNSVKSFMGKSGASVAQIETLSMGQYGATPNVAKNSAEAKHDRRVDLVKIPAGASLPSGPPSAAPDAGAVPAAATKPAGEGS